MNHRNTIIPYKMLSILSRMTMDAKAAIILTVYVLLALSLSFCGCNFTPAFAPSDFAYHPPQPVVVDTCTEYIEVTEPKFVTGYFIYEDMPFVEGIFIVGTDSVYIHTDYDLKTIIHDMLEAWKPQFKYRVFRSDDPWFLDLAIIAEGTNDPSEFRPFVKMYFQGIHAGMGWHPQGFTFLKAVDADEFLGLIIDYPSVDYVSFIESGFDSTTVVKLSLEITEDCKAGRNTADFRYLGFQVPDTIIDLYIERGWEHVLY